MISINLEKKLQNQGIKLKDFEDEYSKKILDYEHLIVTRYKNGGLKNRFGLSINLVANQLTKYKLEEVFFSLYNTDINLRIFINTIFNQILTLNDARKLLNKILVMNSDEIKSIIDTLNSFKNTNLKNTLEKIFNYDRDRNKITSKFIEADFRVCIYCNRNFISNFHTKNAKRATFTLDHYYQKDKSPIFALSLYNLIPSCAVCNTNIKNTRDIEHYENPHSSNYNFHNNAKFKLMPNYKIRLVSSNLKCKKYIRDFYHNEIYNSHSLEVKEFVQRREIFTDDFIKKISKLTKHSESRIKSFIFGDIIYKRELGNESLSKLKVDLSKELKII